MHLDHIQFFDQLNKKSYLTKYFMPIYNVQITYCLGKNFLTVDKYLTYYNVRGGQNAWLPVGKISNAS